MEIMSGCMCNNRLRSARDSCINNMLSLGSDVLCLVTMQQLSRDIVFYRSRGDYHVVNRYGVHRTLDDVVH